MARIEPATLRTIRAASLGSSRVVATGEAEACASSDDDLALAFSVADDATDALARAVTEPAAASAAAASGLIV